MRMVARALVLLVVVVFVENALAQGLLPLGGRTASMGGAGAAAGRDAAMPYINPAGFAQVPHHTLSLSASIYRKHTLKVDDFFYFGRLDSDLEDLGDVTVVGNGIVSDTFSTFPGAANMIWHFGKDVPEAIHHVLALSFIVPRNELLSYKGRFSMLFGDGQNTFRHTISNVVNDTDYYFGPVYAINFGRFRLGLSAFFTYSDRVISQETSTNASLGPDYLRAATTYYSETDIVGFQPVLGLQWNPVGGFSIGLSGSAPSVHVWGKTEGQASGEQSAPPATPGGNYVQLTIFEGPYKRVQPSRIRLGLAYEAPKKWAIALDGVALVPFKDAIDVKIAVATSYQEQGAASLQVRDELRVTDDKVFGYGAHLGGEVFLNGMLSLRLGASYQKANDAIVAQAEDELDMRIDLVSATAGVGIEGPLGETTLGFQFDYGWGQTIAADHFRDEEETYYEVTDVRSYGFVFFLSGAFDLQEFEAVMKAARNPSMLLGEKRVPLALADISPELAKYERVPVVDRTMKENKFEYTETGVPEMDTVLQRVARVKATMVLSRAVLLEFEARMRDVRAQLEGVDRQAAVLNQLLQFARTGEKGTSWKKVDKLERVDETVEVLRLADAVRDLLERLGTETAQLPGDVQRLIDEAPERFRGPDAVLLPAVARSLGSAENDVADAIEEIPGLCEALAGALGALVVEDNS